MVSIKSEGVILKRRNFSEADRILTIFTKTQGKVSVLAKGVRRITSRRAGNIELLNRVIVFLHQGKGMPILTEAKAVDTYPNLKNDLTLSTYAFHIIELLDKLLAENQENPILYGHMVEVLNRLSKKPRQILIRAFEAKILSNLGFATFQRQGVNLIHPRGGSILEELELRPWDEIENMEINEREALELERILRYHCEKILENRLNSLTMLKRMKN